MRRSAASRPRPASCSASSRLASRVLWPLAEFACENEQDLYQGVHGLPWLEHVRADGTLAVDAHVSGPVLTHEHYAALRVKDAIVDRIRADAGERPSVDTENPDLRVNLAVRKGRATVSVDMGNGPLHRRGWRCRPSTPGSSGTASTTRPRISTCATA